MAMGSRSSLANVTTTTQKFRVSGTGPGSSTQPARRDIAKVKEVDTVIIGNGPSALFLSYLLHGSEPHYTSSNPHPDQWLHNKLVKTIPRKTGGEDVNLYDALETPAACDALTSHFLAANSMSYSTQALPLNTLVDTLLRPMADIAVDECVSRVKWVNSTSVSHVILGEEKESGGQWAGDEIYFGEEEDEEGDHGIRTLSYADMLSLPGYSVMDHYSATHAGKQFPEFVRPSRRLVAQYYATYPKAVGIQDSIYTGVSVLNVSQTSPGSPCKFAVMVLSTASAPVVSIRPRIIYCNNIVLASGIFSHTIPPPPEIAPLLSLNASTASRCESDEQLPVLVLGSGYTAADAILCHESSKPIIHVYKWQPEVKPSPLKGCHPQAYPNYARIHKQMKDAAVHKPTSKNYEGFANGKIIDVKVDGRIRIQLTTSTNGVPDVVERKVSGLKVGIGRRGRIDYLSKSLQEQIGLKSHDILPVAAQGEKSRRSSTSKKELWVRAQSLRSLVEENIEVAPNVFVIGSLTGDSLVRYAMGGCIYTAGRIIGYNQTSSKVATTTDEVEVDTDEDGVLVQVPSVEVGFMMVTADALASKDQGMRVGEIPGWTSLGKAALRDCLIN